ncbi:MAG: SDR family oxidoreductase [Clostridia bacterium]|nr:SDR family oxidoreductase [Clostridia bacterium]
MKRVIVTGGAGFIGSHLCKALLKAGNSVVCVDNFFTGREANILGLEEYGHFQIIRHDVVDAFFIEADQIYNLACPASPVHYQADPIKTLKTNILGALNVLELAQKVNACVLQASTSEVYGNPLEHPQTEKYLGNVNSIGIRSCYDEGKRAAETLYMDFHRTRDVDVRIVRIFNTYGPNMRPDDGRVVSNFIVQALTGVDITIYGDGSQTRSFCYVSDLVDGLIRMMNNENGFIGPVNLGNPGEFTMIELAQKVIDLTNSSSKIVFCDLPSDDPVRRKPDISRAEEYLNWKPTVWLDEGLKHTIKYFDDLLSKSRAER